MIVDFTDVKMGILPPNVAIKYEAVKKPLRQKSEGFLYF